MTHTSLIDSLNSAILTRAAYPVDEARELLKEANAALEQLQEIRKAALTTNAKKSNRRPQ